MNRLPYLFACLSLAAVSAAAKADVCSNEVPAIIPYTMTFACSPVEVIVEGEKYVDEDWDCFSLLPVANESVFSNAMGRRKQLPTPNALLRAQEKNFKDRAWMVTGVQCEGSDSLTVTFSSGGNCKGCERKVRYRFAPDGDVVEATLR